MKIEELYPNLKHELTYSMYSCKINWCDTCKCYHHDGFKENDKFYHIKTKFDNRDFPKPKTNIEELLFHLMTEKQISLFDFPYLVSYRTRISDLQLKYGLFLERKFETKTNKYGNAYTYAIHSLPESEKSKAIELYNKLNSESKQKLIKT